MSKNKFNANIINQSEFNDFVFALADYADTDGIKKWVLRNVRNFLIHEDSFYQSYIHESQDHAPHWVYKALKDKKTIHIFSTDIAYKNTLYIKLRETLDWLNANQINRTDRMSVPEAISQSDSWHQSLAKEAFTKNHKIKELKSDILLIKQLSDGHSIVNLQGQTAFLYEGQQMQHCIVSYFKGSQNGDMKVYSLRDAQNTPCVTFSVQNKLVQEIQGPYNTTPKTIYHADLISFFQEQKWEASRYCRAHLGWFSFQGKTYISADDFVNGYFLKSDEPKFDNNNAEKLARALIRHSNFSGNTIPEVTRQKLSSWANSLETPLEIESNRFLLLNDMEELPIVYYISLPMIVMLLASYNFISYDHAARQARFALETAFDLITKDERAFIEITPIECFNTPYNWASLSIISGYGTRYESLKKHLEPIRKRQFSEICSCFRQKLKSNKLDPDDRKKMIKFINWQKEDMAKFYITDRSLL